MRGAVASAHPLSTAAGYEILERGGSAYDATLAVSAALTVVQPHMNGLGADFFAVVHDGEFRSINGSGWAAGLAHPEAYHERGLAAVPSYGPLAAITVPGMVASWTLLAERATMPLREIFAPAIRWAREGFEATPSLARAAADASEHSDDDWKRVYAAVAPGRRLVQTELGRTLAGISADAGHSFYHGELARTIVRDVEAKGGLLRFPDLDGYRAEWTTPLRVRYRDFEVRTTPPNSQGVTALVWLNLLARTDLASLSPAEYVAALLETMRVAYRYRARYIGDPRETPFPDELLDPSFPYAPGPSVPPGATPQGDTTAFSVTDGSVGISAIQSNYLGFGSGVTVRSTGINLNDRGTYFTLDPVHHNVLRAGKRPFHTLMAIVATRPDTEVLLGTMGGDVQPQTNVQVLTRLIDRGEPIQAAIAAPRFAWPASIYRSAPLFAESGATVPGALSAGEDHDLFGHAQGIVRRDGLEVGIDPRGDGRIEAKTGPRPPGQPR